VLTDFYDRFSHRPRRADTGRGQFVAALPTSRAGSASVRRANDSDDAGHHSYRGHYFDSGLGAVDGRRTLVLAAPACLLADGNLDRTSDPRSDRGLARLAARGSAAHASRLDWRVLRILSD